MEIAAKQAASRIRYTDFQTVPLTSNHSSLSLPKPYFQTWRKQTKLEHKIDLNPNLPTMSPLIFRSRFFSLLKNRHGRLMSSDLASTPSKDALNASQKLVSDQIPPDAQTTSATSSSSSSSKPWNFFKYSLIGALTGATAVAGYASYGILSLPSL